jgi:hypothetical protein
MLSVSGSFQKAPNGKLVRHGKGKMEYGKTHAYYEGDWEDDMKSGIGKEVLPGTFCV